MRLGYLGPAGTFAQAALRASAGAAADDAELVPLAGVHDTVIAVRDGTVDRGIVPIENSVEGSVNTTLDALTLDAPEVAIVGEHVLPVRLALIARAGVDLADIAAVVSHPHATAQCARFLREHLPGARVLPASSTAEAVRAVAEGDDPWAAIGTPLAAELYGAVVLRDAIEDEHEHATRFVWLSRDRTPWPQPAEGAAFKTSIVFAGAGDDSPGWLVRCLSEFAFRGVNLSRIESRPQRGRLGHYLFLVDADGRDTAAPVQEAVAALGNHCQEVRVIGSYAAAPDRP
jgi:prephenate dehydratase